MSESEWGELVAHARRKPLLRGRAVVGDEDVMLTWLLYKAMGTRGEAGGADLQLSVRGLAGDRATRSEIEVALNMVMSGVVRVVLEQLEGEEWAIRKGKVAQVEMRHGGRWWTTRAVVEVMDGNQLNGVLTMLEAMT